MLNPNNDLVNHRAERDRRAAGDADSSEKFYFRSDSQRESSTGNHHDLAQQAVNQPEFRSFGLTRYIEPIFFYKRILIGSLLLFSVLGWLALLLLPRSYESTAKLQLLVGRESVGLDPSSTTTQTLLMQKSLEEDVNSALEILGSRDVAERVVDDLGTDAILSGFLPPDPNSVEEPGGGVSSAIQGLADRAMDALMAIVELSGVRDPISDRERSILRLQDKVAIFAPKKSSTMIVSAESRSPEVAQAIVSSYVKHFIDRHVNVATTEGSFAFFEQQAKSVESDLSKMLQQRSELLQKNQLVSANNRFSSLTLQQSTIESTILNTVAQMKQTEAELEDLAKRIQEQEVEVVAAKQTQPDQTLSGMKIALYNAELEEKRLRARFYDDHPRLKEVQRQVEAARVALEKLEQESESLSTTPNPIRLKLEEDYLRTGTRLVGLESLLSQSKLQLEEKNAEVNQLLELELKLEQLDRDIEVSKKNLSLLREKEEQARVVENLRQQRISSVGIAQSATLARKAVKPNKPMVLAAALAMGLFFGFAFVGLKELTRKQIRTADDVYRLLGRHVLAEVPNLRWLASERLTPADLRSPRLDEVNVACNKLQSELLLSLGNRNGNDHSAYTIGVLGINDDSGCSLLSMLLALHYSETDLQQTTLIDLDTKKGTVSSVFGLVNQPIIFGQPQLNETTSEFSKPLPIEYVRRNNGRSLSLVGGYSQNGVVSAGSMHKNLQNMLEQVSQESDVVILDFPPADRPDSSMMIAANLDQIVIVVESRKTTIDMAQRVIHQIERGGGSVAGIVLTKTSRSVPGWLEKLLG